MNPTSFMAELQNILMMFQVILYVAVYTGSIVSVTVILGYELATKRRMP